MRTRHNVLDFMRIQTMINALMNESTWIYVTRPERIDDITEELARALNRIHHFREVHLRRCEAGYCPEDGRCVPCDLSRLHASWRPLEKWPPSKGATVTPEPRTTARPKRARASTRGQARARS